MRFDENTPVDSFIERKSFRISYRQFRNGRLQATVASEVLGTFLDEAMDQELAPFAPKSNTFRERCRNILKEDQIT